MKIRDLLNVFLKPTGSKLVRAKEKHTDLYYDQDGLRTWHDHEFMEEPAFRAAYARGVKAGNVDLGWHWRVHVGLWVARVARDLPGDFVECGVGHGFLSSAIMQHLDWDACGKTFWLLDTFAGLDPRFVGEGDEAADALEKNRIAIEAGHYALNVDAVRANFAEWERVQVVVGTVPDTLDQVEAEEVAYLHLDMNCSPPEVAAAEFFWPRLAPGAPVLLDDYAYHGYRAQKVGMDAFAKRVGVPVLSLPTGQGLLVKPHGAA
jgi:hypothetical protein